MKRKNLLTLWAKRAFPALALAAMVLPACDKEPDAPTGSVEPVYRAPYEKELFFNDYNTDSIEMPIVKKFANDTACKHIYLTVMENNYFSNKDADYIALIRNQLNKRIELAPNKISGRGNFRFENCTIAPADSLWFIKQGWTINQKQH